MCVCVCVYVCMWYVVCGMGYGVCCRGDRGIEVGVFCGRGIM
jgi:hypothetical protein